jgi:F-type H+-transporting ATPase subunit alpha
VIIYAATNGFLDRINVDRVEEFNAGLQQRLRSENSELLDKIAGGDWEEGTIGEVDKLVKSFADDFGFDLDEDGQPLSEDEAGGNVRDAQQSEQPSGEGDADGDGESDRQLAGAVSAGSGEATQE